WLLRLLHAAYQLSAGVHLGRRRDDLRAGGRVLLVRVVRALAGPGLHEHLVAGTHDVADALRRERDAILLRLDLAGGAHNHGARPSTSPAWTTSPAATFLPSCGCTRPIVMVPP